MESEGLLEEGTSSVPKYSPKKCEVRLRREDAVSRTLINLHLDPSHTCDLPTCNKASFRIKKIK
jgi:hypothetical protein